MLGKKKQKPRRSPGHFATLISGKPTVEGDVHFSGGLHVDGTIKGRVVAEEGSDAVVRLSEVGEIVGDVVDGEHKGRLLWARLNLENPSDAAVKIARGQLSALCRAVNVLQPRDSIELHNIPLVIKVGVKRRDDIGEFTNEVKGFAPQGGGSGGSASGNGVAPRPAATAGSTPPWER